MSNTKKVSVQIDTDAHELARQAAFEQRKPITTVITEAVKEKLKEESQQEKKK